MGHDRLRRSEDVRAVLRRGRRCARPLVVVHGRPRGDDHPARVAVVASRRIGRSVERNRAKRVLRAAVADVDVPAGLDIALVAREQTGPAGTAATKQDIQSCIEQMFESAGVAGGGRS